MALTKVSTPGIKDEAITLAKLLHGDSNSNGKYLRANNGADPTFESVNTDLINDLSPELGGNLSTNNKFIQFPDSISGNQNRAVFGGGLDLQIYHDGSVEKIESSGGGLHIRQISNSDIHIHAGADSSSSNNRIVARSAGQAELYYSGNKKFETYLNGTKLYGHLIGLDAGKYIQWQGSDSNAFAIGMTSGADNPSGSDHHLQFHHWNNSSWDKVFYVHRDFINIPDNKKIGFGDSNDLLIYHETTGGSNQTYIQNATGNLRIDANALRLRSYTTGHNYLVANSGQAVELYYDNIKTFHTKQNGIVVEADQGAGAILEMRADQGDDNNDYFRLYNADNFLAFQGYGAGSWTTLLSLQQQNQVRLFYNGSEKLNTGNHGVSISGKIYMNNGNLQFGASGNGIDFSATSDASGKTSELLDDYEEGTWTPTTENSGGGFSSVVSATYTKIGRLVNVQLYANFNSNQPNSNQIRIGGLPFSSLGSVYHYAVGRLQGFGGADIVWQVGGTSNYFTPYYNNSIPTYNQVNGYYVLISGSYITS